MSPLLILAIFAGIFALYLLLVSAVRRRSPRVTTIQTRHDKRDGSIETRRAPRDEPTE